MAGKAFLGGKQALAATKQAVVRKSRGGGRRCPAFASKGSSVNMDLKAKQPPPALSNLGKFLGIVDSPQSEFSKTVTQFVKLHNRQNPGNRKDRNFEDKLVAMVNTGQRIGTPEMNKLMAS
ncbi:SWIB/MDM2 domain superfamily protein [Euphorbia peplus]|nr:SWIB/MDM2 domain superfamily protein [Euphorbia peplus]